MTALEATAAARRLLDHPGARIAGVWPRAAALLARQALEQALDGYWHTRGIALSSCPSKPQLVCLAEYLDDRPFAVEVTHAWNALSRACHHHPYELAPTAGELRGWLDVTARFVARAAE